MLPCDRRVTEGVYDGYRHLVEGLKRTIKFLGDFKHEEQNFEKCISIMCC